MQKKECPIHSFTYLKVGEEGEGIRVGQKEYMQQIWIQYRVGSTLRGMLGINKVLDIVTDSQEVKRDVKKSIKSDLHSFTHTNTKASFGA